MNCKPGDLARIVAPFEEAGRGMVVTAVRLAARGEIVRSKLGFEEYPVRSDLWVCDAHDERFPCLIADECLRPIRGHEGDDETLAWAGKPEQVAA